MASISNDPGGRRRILFNDKNGKRKTIWLGKISKRLAEEIKIKVESINTANIAGRDPDRDTADWLAKIGDGLHAKLAKSGLTSMRQPPTPAKASPALGDYTRNYIDGRTHHKPNTTKTIDQARRVLVEHFGGDRPIDAISLGDAEDWLNALRAGGYKPATISTHVKKAKQMFAYAVDKELLARNPFEKLKAPEQIDKSREEFIDRDTIHKVLDACPDAEWRLIVALSRFGGLRCPSEHVQLAWDGVDWKYSRFHVHAPKTNDHRWVPIFPELLPYLEEAYELAADGVPHVIARYRDGDQNLRTQFLRIIKRARVVPWGRLFHNLRSSRQTELEDIFPTHVVCAWLGNTPRVARKHYLQVTEEHYKAAIANAPNIAPRIAPKGKTSQNTSQHGARTEHAPNEKTPELSGFSSKSPVFSKASDYPRQVSNNPAETLETRDNDILTSHQASQNGPDLQQIIDTLSALPEDQRRAVFEQLRDKQK